VIFHLGFELPKPAAASLDWESSDLTSEEVKILKEQIRKNAVFINSEVNRLDLLVNKERYPQQAVFIGKIRARLYLLMEENDTFRKVLWKHYQRRDFVENARSRNGW
jgi:hypothetical protein